LATWVIWPAFSASVILDRQSAVELQPAAAKAGVLAGGSPESTAATIATIARRTTGRDRAGVRRLWTDNVRLQIRGVECADRLRAGDSPTNTIRTVPVSAHRANTGTGASLLVLVV
jgi:hypothetical protein